MSRFETFLIAIAGALWLTPAVSSTDGESCDAILQQDLFNRVTQSSQASASEQAAYEEHLFRMGEDKAWDDYQKAYASSKATDTKIGAEFHYGVIGGTLDINHSYDRRLSEEEFKSTYKEARERYEKDSRSSTSKQASLISLYQSSVRDSASVKAWEQCMTSNRAGPGLIAYGYRDPQGSPYVVVIWAPGHFTASVPKVDVQFAPTDDGITIEGAKGEIQIATGSGSVYPIRFADPNDRRALADGFAVLINGKLKSGETLIQSFHAEAIVPHNLGATPCSLMFAANRTYQIGFFNSEAKSMEWIAHDVRTTARLPSDQTGAVIYEVTMGTPLPSFLKLSGSTLTFTEQVRKSRNSDDLKEVTRMIGDCSGSGIHAKLVGQPPEVPDIRLVIRPR